MNQLSMRRAQALGQSIRVILILVAAAVFAPGLTGCRVITQEFPVERTVDADSERILWDALLLAIDNGNYAVGSPDPGAREIRSGWKLDLAPFKGKGFRTRAIVVYEPSKGERKGVTSSAVAVGLEAFDVTIRVEKETNESLSPLNLDRANWTRADDDLQAARNLMQTFHGLLGTAEFELEKTDSLFDLE